jgi:hypothetical protein
MKKLILALVMMSLTIGNVYPAVGWSKAKPAGSVSPAAIDDAVRENNDALDLMLSTYANVKLSYATAATVTVSAGGVMVSNSTGATRLMLANAAATTVTWSNIDTGSEATSTTYYVYAVGSDTTDTTFTCKISTSSTAPSGVTYYKRLGSFYNNASGNIESVSDDDLSYQSGLGDWVSKTSSYGTQQATTDGFIIATAHGIGQTMIGFTDSSSSPTTARIKSTNGDEASISIYFPVKKNDYWKITLANGTMEYAYFIPIGD